MFIIDINKDSHRVMMNRINTKGIILKTVWKEKTEYCFDTIEYKDYVWCKELQIQMDRYYNNVPIV